MDENMPVTILFVDDEPNIITAIKRMFIEKDLTILTATTGSEALKFFDSHSVDIAVTDNIYARHERNRTFRTD